MFTAPLVGSANALAGGWGNLGETPDIAYHNLLVTSGCIIQTTRHSKQLPSDPSSITRMHQLSFLSNWTSCPVFWGKVLRGMHSEHVDLLAMCLCLADCTANMYVRVSRRCSQSCLELSWQPYDFGLVLCLKTSSPRCRRAGGGVTNLVMPRIYERILEHQPSFIAWRWAYFVPGAMHITLATLVILFAQVFTCKDCSTVCLVLVHTKELR